MILLKIISALAPKAFSALSKTEADSEFNSGVSFEKKEQSKKYKESQQIILKCQYPIGSFFITVCNEWHAMTIVEIKGYDGRIPFGTDILTKKDLLLFSNLMPYSESMIRTLKKLDPYERYAISSHKNHILDRKDKIEDKNCLFENELSADDFIDALNSYKQEIIKDVQ